MILAIQDYVNEAPPSSSIGSITPSLTEIDPLAPIDQYVKYTRSLLNYGTVERLRENPVLGGLLLLGAVSAAEAYFRSVLSASLEICPICRKTAGEKQINLGGVLWHGQEGFRRSAFEHMSFSSREELSRAASGYLAFTLKDSSFKVPLSQYDIACHLRHGIVHNGGILPGRNAVQLGVRKFERPVEIIVDFSLLQRTIAAVDTLVLTFNRELFSEMCERWAVQWRRREDWDPSREVELFNSLWLIFFSRELNKIRSGRSKISRKKCLDSVRAKFNL